jgi:hypothetical protein
MMPLFQPSGYDYEHILELFDRRGYSATAINGHKHFIEATPFPHAVFDRFLPPNWAMVLAGDYPAQNEAWTIHDNPNVGRQFLGDETKVTPLFRTFMHATASRQFLLFLETLTGIEGLIPDPYYIGGGAMSAGYGDHLAMHCDFNWHYKLHAHRRLNALFYLTPDWQAQWGGELVLTNGDRTIERSILPFFNRLVVFKVTDHSWHGQPEKLTCPADVRRNVFSAFYYTAATDEQVNDPHLTKYHHETPYTAKPLKDYKGG